MKSSKCKCLKAKLRKLRKALDAKPYKSHTVELNEFIHITAYGWRTGDKIIYELQGWFDTKPYSGKAGWNCFYASSVYSFTGQEKKIAKALHRYLGR